MRWPNAIRALIVPAPRGTTITGKKHDRTNRPPGRFAIGFMNFLSGLALMWKSCPASVRNANNWIDCPLFPSQVPVSGRGGLCWRFSYYAPFKFQPLPRRHPCYICHYVIGDHVEACGTPEWRVCHADVAPPSLDYCHNLAIEVRNLDHVGAPGIPAGIKAMLEKVFAGCRGELVRPKSTA